MLKVCFKGQIVCPTKKHTTCNKDIAYICKSLDKQGRVGDGTFSVRLCEIQNFAGWLWTHKATQTPAASGQLRKKHSEKQIMLESQGQI